MPFEGNNLIKEKKDKEEFDFSIAPPMEGNNNDEAERQAEAVMAEAEKCFLKNDVEGANGFAAKAESLCPSHPQVPRLLAALRVHIAAKAKPSDLNTEYCCSILGVKPTDDIATMKRQYKAMCLLTHPDKNQSAAAEGAIKLVMDAWDFLSKNTTKGPNTGGAGTNSDANGNGGTSAAKPDSSSDNNSNSGQGTSTGSGSGSGTGTGSDRSGNEHTSNANRNSSSSGGQGTGNGSGFSTSSDRSDEHTSSGNGNSNQSDEDQPNGHSSYADGSSNDSYSAFDSNFASSSSQSSAGSHDNANSYHGFSSDFGTFFEENYASRPVNFANIEADVKRQETELVRKLFSWSVEDIFNKDLFKDKVSGFCQMRISYSIVAFNVCRGHQRCKI